MADKKISELDAITGADTASDDFFIVVDTSGSATKKISRAELNNAIEQDVLAQVDITSANIDGGTIDNTPIGATTAAAGTFTDLTATGTVTGLLTELSDDTTPQLGGNLDLNSFDITGNGDINTSGSLEVDGAVIFNQSGADVDFRVESDANPNMLRVDAGNNRVGIGKGNPATSLDVAGTVTMLGADVNGNGDISGNLNVGGTVTADGLTVEAATPEITVSSTTLANLATIKFTSGGVDVDSKITHQANTGVMTIDSGRNASWGGKIDFVTDTVKRANISNNGDVSLYDSSGVSQGFFWDASTQRLGLGDTTPSSAIQISGSDAAGGRLEVTRSGVSMYVGSTGADGYIQTPGAHSLQFYTNGTLRQTITSGGNVGIGTASPTSALTVDGDIKGFNSFNNASYEIAARIGAGTAITGSNDPYLDMRRWTGSGTNHGSGSIAVDTGANMRFQTNASVSGPATSERMRIDSSGNVGIGTSTPSQKLEVEGALQLSGSGSTLKFEKNGSGVDNALYYDNTVAANNLYIGRDSSNLICRTGGDERMRIDSSGNVGIGTTTINDQLVVNSSSAEEGITIRGNNFDALKIGLVNPGTSNDGVIGMKISNALRFITNDTERMRIDSSGNLMVGTTNANPASNNVAGVALKNGSSHFSTDGAEALRINRKTSDGQLVSLRKDATEVGSIFSYNGFLGIGSPSGNDAYMIMGSDFIAPATSTGAARDAAIDLGSSSRRFKDLYLSGGVYLGGTGSANYLDDYEEGSGSFTSVTDSSGNALTTINNDYYYTKVGRFVQLEIRVQLSSATTGEVRLNGTPFTMSSNDTELGVVINRNVFAASSSQIRLRAGTNNSYMYGVVTYRTS